MGKVVALVALFLVGCGAASVKSSVATDGGKECSDSSECEGLCLPPDSAYSAEAVNAHDPKFPRVVVSGSDRRKLTAVPGQPLLGVCSAVSVARKPSCGTYITQGILVSSGPCESLRRSE